MRISDRLFAESKFCRAMAIACAVEWFCVIWLDSKVEIAATTIAGAAALVLSHRLYRRAYLTNAHERHSVVREEFGKYFRNHAP